MPAEQTPPPADPPTPGTAGSLAGARVLVAGASAGIGRIFTLAALRAGARVVMAARRGGALEEIRAEAGGHPVTADLTVPADVDRLAQTVRGELGGLDVLVCCTGSAPLRMLRDTEDADWDHVLRTNVVGVHRLLRGCLPLLDRSAMVLALSSETVYQPRTGLGAYGTSKAALERLIEGWRAEHPWLRFTTVTIGATFPTDFGRDFEDGLLGRLLDDWSVRGLAQQEFMAPEDVANVLLGTVATGWRLPGVCLEHLVLRSPSPVAGTFGSALDLPDNL